MTAMRRWQPSSPRSAKDIERANGSLRRNPPSDAYLLLPDSSFNSADVVGNQVVSDAFMKTLAAGGNRASHGIGAPKARHQHPG